MKYRQEYDGWWFYPQRRGWKMKCCDCGLVHRVNFQIAKRPNGQQKILLQAFRDERATAAVRREKAKREKRRG